MGLETLKSAWAYHNNGKKLGLLYKPLKERQQCPEHCETCDLTKTKGKYLIKSVVYKIKCKYCNSVYIGETARTIGSRIKEQVRSQTVYNHLKTHINNPTEDNCTMLKYFSQPIHWRSLSRRNVWIIYFKICLLKKTFYTFFLYQKC